MPQKPPPPLPVTGFILLGMILVLMGCPSEAAPPHPDESAAPEIAIPAAKRPKINGASLESPSRPIEDIWVEPLQANHVNWVAIIPFASGRLDDPALRYNQGHWWGERSEGAAVLIDQAHRKGLKVMLKPQVWIPGSWPGAFTLPTPEAWSQWEAQYADYLFSFQETVKAHNVELVCLGTELSVSFVQRPAFWRKLIADWRAACPGTRLTVAANWDNYQAVTFWDALDTIGIDAYFPLTDEPTPTLETLLARWAPQKAQLAAFSERHRRPILFTEYGYQSVDRAAWRHWETGNLAAQPLNLEAQARAYEGLFQALWGESWFEGGFFWKWHTAQRNRGDRMLRDFTPQNKPAEAVIRRYYGQYG